MKAAPLILLLLMASPAMARENMFGFLFQGRDCDQPPGMVSHWPEVRRARERERLCLSQQLATDWQDKAALDAASAPIYQLGYTPMTVRTAPAEPAPAPPPPSVPTNPTGGTAPTQTGRTVGGEVRR